MDNQVHDFIESGILEAYVTGSASAAEEREVLYMKQKYAEVNHELQQLETGLEKIAKHMAITPPPDLWNRMEAEFNELTTIPHEAPLKIGRENKQHQNENTKKEPNYIEVEAESSHMRVHKAWKWVFVAVFVLGKIFLACAIYFYLENRQAQQNMQELKQEVKELRELKNR